MASGTSIRPRVGVPFRALKEEVVNLREKIEPYLLAVQNAGGEPVEISLHHTQKEIEQLAASLDAVLLPGSPADVDPAWYHELRHERCAEPDPWREQADFALLDCAFAARKPVLAICYGVQSLNVYLGGTLIQDIATDLPEPLKHDWTGRKNGEPEPYHEITIEPGSRLAQLAGALTGNVNSSHHQALRRTGRELRVVARAVDGVIEAVEYIGDDASVPGAGAPWITGVQWHPERMTGDPLALALFRELVTVARNQVVGRGK